MKWSGAAPWGGSFRAVPGASIAAHLRLVRPLTSPGARHVWVADHLVLETEVAVKFCASPDGAERFLRQARSTARIAEPHLLQVLEHGKIKDSAFLVTELLEGRSLRQRLLTGPLTSSEARAVVAQTAGVLAKAHALGMWHGSLCPEHLFLTETAGEHFIKLSAFGDTFAAASEAAPGTPSSAAYQSPEQLLRGVGSGASSDLWALAVTVYELLTSTLPFRAPTEAALNVAICNAQFTPPTQYRTDLPPLLDAWFRLALAKDPTARFADPLEFAHEFAHATAPEHRAKRGESGGAQGGRSASGAERDEDEDVEERTMRWALPTDWALPNSGGITRPIPSPSIRNISSGPPPLPNRAPSSRPPPVWATPAALPELPRMRAPQGLSPYNAPTARFAKTKGLLAGAVLGAAGALAAWIYQSSDSPEPEATTASALPPAARGIPEPAPVATVSNSPAPHAAAQPVQDDEQLPVILNTDELPKAPDELPFEEEEADQEAQHAAAGVAVVPAPTVGSAPEQNTGNALGSGHAGRTEREGIPASLSAPSAAASAAGTSHASAREEGSAPPKKATPSALATRRETPQRAKPASSIDDCNPPYFFDERNIRRLKLECL
jgi:eukaryotic-like serine/threonine-protein kinase